jgi:hypothetical protein
VRKLRWLLAAMAILVFVSGCGGAEIAASVVDHAAPEIDAARVAEISASDTSKIALPSETVVDATTAVSTPYVDVSRQEASGLSQSAADEASAVSDATESAATDPLTGGRPGSPAA